MRKSDKAQSGAGFVVIVDQERKAFSVEGPMTNDVRATDRVAQANNEKAPNWSLSFYPGPRYALSVIDEAKRDFHGYQHVELALEHFPIM